MIKINKTQEIKFDKVEMAGAKDVEFICIIPDPNKNVCAII